MWEDATETEPSPTVQRPPVEGGDGSPKGEEPDGLRRVSTDR